VNLVNFTNEKANSILNSVRLKGMWSGEKQPLVSLPFLDFIKSYNFSDWNILEFGSGYSTYYFSKIFKKVTSIETDIDFYNSMINDFTDTNVDLYYVEIKDLEDGNYKVNIDNKTIVFIDSGGNRLKTSKSLISKVKPNIIIVDNAEWFPNQCKFLYQSGYSEIPFWGIRFEENIDKSTSLFIKDGFKMIEKDYSYFTPGAPFEHKIHSDNDWIKND
jgi:hypothetical protein